jgi:hypothetical protein
MPAVASLFEPCSRLEPLRVSRLPTAPSPSARRTRLFCLTSPLLVYMVGWGGAQAFHPKEDNAPGLVSLRLPIPEAISSLGCHAGGVAARTARAGFGVIL